MTKQSDNNETIAYTLSDPKQNLSVQHDSISFSTPTGIAVDLKPKTGGFNFDRLDNLYLEEPLTSGARVFALIAHYTEWDGTFGNDTPEAQIVGLSYAQNSIVELENWIDLHREDKPTYKTGGYAPWQGYGCGLNAMQIVLLPVL